MKKFSERKSSFNKKNSLRRENEEINNREIEEEPIDSLENSTENTRKKILPNRVNRGQRMKALQGKELDEEDELYNLIFAEKSSDEDFNPSQSELSDDSLREESLEINEEPNEVSQSVHNLGMEQNKKRNHKNFSNENNGASHKRNKNKEEIFDLDLIDLDKIDEIEELRDKGIDVQDAENFESEDFSDQESSKRKNTKKKKKHSRLVKPIVVLKDDEMIGNRTKKIDFKKKSFIDHNEDGEFLRKKHKFKKVGLKKKSKSKKITKNQNVLFRNNFNELIINKKILNDEYEEVDSNEELNDSIMKYNDETYMYKHNIKNIEEENANTKNLIKKYKKDKIDSGVKYNFMPEKLSQKELLLEAIFTEYYNIQSLQEMQRLEDINKKENPTPGKKQFNEYVRIVKRIEKERDETENKNTDNEINIIGKEEMTNEKMQKESKDEKQNYIKPPENYITFSNPTFYENLFKTFNTITETKQIKLCTITGQPAKYFDPLTKQYYSNIESFKMLRERYFQKEEDNLLFRIQTLSDFASQKKEKLKKLILSETTGNQEKNSAASIINLVNKYGILKNENQEDKKVVNHRIYSRNRENCVESGMLLTANKKYLLISKRIFRDKFSSRITNVPEEDKI